MPQLLLELFSEEIPARMQAQAAKDLERMTRERLAAEGLLPQALAPFAGPRRVTLDGQVVPFTIDGHVSGDLTEGHRFMGTRRAFHVKDFDSYADGLAKNFVVLDPEERKERIADAARTLCFARNFELVDDEGLLDEVAGLTEWPVPIPGELDPAFLDRPPEVIRTSLPGKQR